jgi:hypothetical protein
MVVWTLPLKRSIDWKRSSEINANMTHTPKVIGSLSGLTNRFIRLPKTKRHSHSITDIGREISKTVLICIDGRFVIYFFKVKKKKHF